MADDARHATGFEQILDELGLRPARRAVGAVGGHAAAARVAVAGGHQHAPVRQFGDVGLAGVAQRDVAALPGLAVVVTVNDPHCFLQLGLLLVGGHPERRDEPAALQLHGVAGPGGNGLPVQFGTELVEGGRDLDRRGPRDAVILAADVEAAHVLDAVEQMHRAVAGGNGDGIVDGLFVRPAHVLFLLVLRHVRVARQTRAEMGDLLRRRPRASAVGAAAEVNLDLAPVGDGELARLAIGEHRAFGRHDDSRNAIERGSRPSPP